MKIQYGNFIIDGKDKSGLIEEVSADVGRRLVNAGLASEATRLIETTAVGDSERTYVPVEEPRKPKKGK